MNFTLQWGHCTAFIWETLMSFLTPLPWPTCMLSSFWFLCLPIHFLKRGCSPLSKLVPSCLLPISHADDKHPLQEFSLSPQYLCCLSLEPCSCFTALSQLSSERCKELVKEQRKVEECSSTPKEPTLPLLPTLLCGALSAAAPPPPAPAPSPQVSGLQHRGHGVGGRQGGQIDMVLFSLKFTPRLNCLGYPCLSLTPCSSIPPCHCCAEACPLWATWLASVFPSSMQSTEKIKLWMQAVLGKELTETATFTHTSLFPWLLGAKLNKGIGLVITSALHCG